ncbi:YigZ family protein [Oscillospiraceae bacterium MB08-C2-2]|nr:YigZ family protein [Oscillospiraceae bacterium MB08-C2-2]
MEEYTTISAEAVTEFTERRSRFIGAIAPVSTPEEAMAYIASKKEAYWDASHNCSAYVLRQGQLRRYSDDGEPQGTAGIPILDVLQKAGLTDVVAVVTRYFGGILLGAGGLVRAYSQGASQAVAAAEWLTMTPAAVVEMSMDYSLYGKVSYLLPQLEASVLASDFGERVRLEAVIRKERLSSLEKQLSEVSAGVIVPRLIETRYHDFG